MRARAPLVQLLLQPDDPGMNDARKPGDFLLDRFFPDADEATRERARAAFLEYGRALVARGERLMAGGLSTAQDSEVPREGAKMDSAAQAPTT